MLKAQNPSFGKFYTALKRRWTDAFALKLQNVLSRELVKRELKHLGSVADKKFKIFRMIFWS